MFKKEAKEYATDNYENCLYDDLPYANDSRAREQSFKDGAEFGYNKAKEDADKMKSQFLELCNLKDIRIAELEKANEWHKVADGDLPKGDEGYGETSIHRKIYLKDRDGNLYTGRYYPKDESHPEDCFAVEFLDWGLQGSHFCAKVQISEWCEIPKYTKED